MKLSTVIPSKSLSNFLACAQAVRQHEPLARIILVDDGLPLAWVAFDHIELEPWKYELGPDGFVFARNVNLGIKAAGDDDVVILNDDALLQTPRGFSLLQQAAEEHPEYGIIAATTNNVGNRNQFPQNKGLREDPRMVCFVCVLIPRRTIETVGLLDERFVGYGLDDDDYSLRVRNAGLKIGIHDGCFVDHKSLQSTFRGPAGAGGNFLHNMKLFIEKWGVDNWGKDRTTSDFRQLFA